MGTNLRPLKPREAGRRASNCPISNCQEASAEQLLMQAGAAVAGARVTLTREDQSPSSKRCYRATMGNSPLPTSLPEPFQLTITAAGFATQTFSGILRPGEIYIVPQITLAVATAVTEVQVVAPAGRSGGSADQGMKRSSACSASFRISMSATSPMQFRSPRSKSSSLPGRRPSIRSPS